MTSPLPTATWYTAMLQSRNFDSASDQTLAKGFGVGASWLVLSKPALAEAVRQVEKTDPFARNDLSKLARTILDRNAIFERLDWRNTKVPDDWASQALGTFAVRCATAFPQEKTLSFYHKDVFNFEPTDLNEPADPAVESSSSLVVQDTTTYIYRGAKSLFYMPLWEDPVTQATRRKRCIGRDVTITCYISGRPRYNAKASEIWNEKLGQFSLKFLLQGMKAAGDYQDGERIFVNPHPQAHKEIVCTYTLTNRLIEIWKNAGCGPVDVTVKTGPANKGHLASEREIYGKVFWDELARDDPFRPQYDEKTRRPNVPVPLPGRYHVAEEWEDTDEEIDGDEDVYMHSGDEGGA